MISDILEQKLADAGFVRGRDLFRDFMPAECAIGVMTRIPLQGMKIDPYIPGFYKGQMQVVVRHKEPDLGSALSRQVQSILTVEGGREYYEGNEERGPVHLDLFYPETLPIYFPRLSGNGFEWSQHFSCVFGLKSPI